MATQFRTVEAWAASNRTTRPVALVLAEDAAGLSLTLEHLQNLGFPEVLILGDNDPATPASEGVGWVSADVSTPLGALSILNRVLPYLSDRWVHFGYNAEFLFFPYCESRQIEDLTQFLDEERRESTFGSVIDLYPSHFPLTEISREGTMLDSGGYYSEARSDESGEPIERQVEIFGGLKRRFEEHVPYAHRRIDRVPLFKARQGLRLDENFRLSDEELNTISCPWHHNLTACVASYRTAKALSINPGSRRAISDLQWSGSLPFEWNSRQLMEHGFMEPGQWF